MSKNIQIRDVPEKVHRILKSKAAAAGVSLSDYLRAEITQAAERPAIAEVLSRAQGRAPELSTDDIVAAVRSGRDRPPKWL